MTYLKKIHYVFIITGSCALLMLVGSAIRLMRPVKVSLDDIPPQKATWSINYTVSNASEVKIKNSLGMPPTTPPEFIMPRLELVLNVSSKAKSTLPEIYTHTVKRGDTLTIIMKGYTNDWRGWEAVANKNSLAPPYRLDVGSKLLLPSVNVIKSTGHILLKEQVETKEEKIARELFSPQVNPPPVGTFKPPEEKLHLSGVITRRAVVLMAKYFLTPVFISIFVWIAFGVISSKRRPLFGVKRLALPMLGFITAEIFVLSLMLVGAKVYASSIIAQVVTISFGASIVGIYTLLGGELQRDELPSNKRFAQLTSGSFAVLGIAAALSNWMTEILIVMA